MGRIIRWAARRPWAPRAAAAPGFAAPVAWPLLRRFLSLLHRPAVCGVAMGGVAVVGAVAAAASVLPHPASAGRPESMTAGRSAHAAAHRRTVTAAASYRHIILPDLLVVAPKGLTAGQLARLRDVPGFRHMITFDGAEITAGGRRASVIGVDPGQFRSWVPLRTASDQALWAALARGEFVASDAARSRLRLRHGATYALRAATVQDVRFGGAARLGLTGVDLLVNSATSGELGLVHKVAALISAPAARLSTLVRAVSAVLGPTGEIVSLRAQQLPVTKASTDQLPTTYLQLFQESAARYCPGLSWTVLAAIGQIESADGTNVGPSTAGALGPMQFLPSTWRLWGIDGFGQTGKPDIMNPYDAVPSAARLLCADGAAAGGTALRSAIFDYNHATWYVNEVLALAAAYAADYH
jgi:Transglycosylase SLT domain